MAGVNGNDFFDLRNENENGSDYSQILGMGILNLSGHHHNLSLKDTLPLHVETFLAALAVFWLRNLGYLILIGATLIKLLCFQNEMEECLTDFLGYSGFFAETIQN